MLRREHPPTYGLRWGPVYGAADVFSSTGDFRLAYMTQLQKGAGDDDERVMLGRHLMHVLACYCVAGFRPLLCPENDYYSDILGGKENSQSIVVLPHNESDSVVRDTLARMECVFPSKQLIQDDCGKLIAMVRSYKPPAQTGWAPPVQV